MSCDFSYSDTRRVAYGSTDDEKGQAIFVPVCPKCGRYVKADAEVAIREEYGLSPISNATCSRCGRVNMPFEGFV